MKNIFLFFSIIILISMAVVSAECNGCLSNTQCHNIGDILSNKYCSFSKTFLSQKADNISCQNNFECISNYCMDEICINEQVLTNLGISLDTLAQTQNYLSQGNCTATPGCLNKTSLLNAQNVSGICIGNIKCFQCNLNTPYWNGSACTLPPCHYDTPGCWNKSRINEIDHYENISESCNSGFMCIKCARNYVWNGESSCVYYSGGSGSGSGGSSTPIIWKTNATFTESSLINGFTTKLKARERISLSFKGISYFIGVVSLTSSSATINISSKSQQIIINTGNEKRIDLDNDGTEDISITLSTVSFIQATLLIKKLPPPQTPTCTNGETHVKYCPGGTTINSEICENGIFIATSNKCTAPVQPATPSSSNNLLWTIIIVSIIIAIIITLVLIIYFLKKGKPKSTFTKPDFPRYTPSRPSFPRPITGFPPNRKYPPNPNFPRKGY